jgi:ABC-type nickel/cobalt efflux system permease component RcnA
MTARFWIRLAEISFVLVLATAILVAWREDRRDRAQLAVALEQAKQALSAADARQHDRDAQLSQTLATLAAQKNRTQTPSQILADLPNQIPLPVPMTLEPVAQPASSRTDASPGSAKSGPEPGSPTTESPKPQATQAVIPSQDLKPLYDFALDCKSCQAKLTASQGDLADEKAKTAALSKERDAAVKAAKGGSILQRVVRAAKWFALGAAAGALAAKTAR